MINFVKGKNMYKSIDIIDKSEKLEQSTKKVWARNVFFIWWYALFFAATIVRATWNRICQYPRYFHNINHDDNRPYVRKVSKYKWLEEWNILVDSNYWHIWVMFLFFFFVALSKTLYHLWKITFFLWVHVIKPVLWMLIALFAAKTVSQSLSKKGI